MLLLPEPEQVLLVQKLLPLPLPLALAVLLPGKEAPLAVPEPHSALLSWSGF